MSDKKNNKNQTSTEELVFFAADILRNEGAKNTRAANREYADIIIDNILVNGRAKSITELENSCEYLGLASKHVSGNHKKLKKKISFLQESLLHFGGKHPFQTVNAVSNMALATKSSNSELFQTAVDVITPFVKTPVFSENKRFRQFLYKSVRRLSDKALSEDNSKSIAPYLHKDIMLACVDKADLEELQQLFKDASLTVIGAKKETPVESLFLNNALTIVDNVSSDHGSLDVRKEILADFDKTLKTVNHKVPAHLKMRIGLKRDAIAKKLDR